MTPSANFVVVFGLSLWICSSFACTDITGNVTDLHLIGLFPKTGAWDGGQGIVPAAEMAVDDINCRSDILPGYRLVMKSQDTRCQRGFGMKILMENIFQKPTKIMIIGAGCSTVSQVVAQAAHYWNLIQISYVSISPALSNQDRYPNFFRVVIPESALNEARMELFRHFNWTRVAMLYEDHHIFSKMVEDLTRRLKKSNLTIVASRVFSDDPTPALHSLKEADARIIVGGFYPNKAREIFCTAYNMNFYKKQVWVTTGALAYDSHWWKRTDSDINCTREQMELVLQETLIVHNIYTNIDETEEGLTGLSVQRFRKMYRERTRNMTQRISGAGRAPIGYDTVWAAAIALNKTMNHLKANGDRKTLAEFSYDDEEMTNLIKSKIHEVNFKSVSGHVGFDEIGDGIRLIGFTWIKGPNMSRVGTFDKKRPKDKIFQIDDIWKGNVPKDSPHIKKVVVLVPVSTYAIMTSLASLGIILAVFFLFFNIFCRNVKIIRMSSPKINNIILFGCILAHLSVYIEDISEANQSIYCKVKISLLLLAFSLSFGALFAKTWRIHSIFTAGLRLRKKMMKDRSLCLMILGLVCLNSLILILWFAIDPLTVKTADMPHMTEKKDDVLIHYVNNYCASENQRYFIITILVIQGVFLLLGVFLAWETRKVKYSIINESRFIALCIYNAVVLGVVGVLVSYSLRNNSSLVYVLNSCITIIGTTVTQCLLFIPKARLLLLRVSLFHQDHVRQYYRHKGNTLPFQLFQLEILERTIFPNLSRAGKAGLLALWKHIGTLSTPHIKDYWIITMASTAMILAYRDFKNGKFKDVGLSTTSDQFNQMFAKTANTATQTDGAEWDGDNSMEEAK